MRDSENRGLKERKLKKKIICSFVAMLILLSIASPVLGEEKKNIEPLAVQASCEGGSIKLTLTSSEIFYTKLEIESDQQEITSRQLFWPGRVVDFTFPVSNKEDTEYAIEIGYKYKGREIEVERTVSCEAVVPPDATEIPEFPTIALPVVAVIGLMYVFQRKKKQN